MTTASSCDSTAPVVQLECTILVRGLPPDGIVAEYPGLSLMPVLNDVMLTGQVRNREELATLLQSLMDASLEVLSASAMPADRPGALSGK